MRAVILVGGLGTRLRPLTIHTPKPLLPLANRPHLDHVFALLRRHGVLDVILAVQYHADAFEARYGTGEGQGIRLQVVREPEPRGTAGAVRNVAAHLATDEPTLVFNGDVLTDLDLAAMLAFHHHHESVCTIALTPVADPSAYGVVDLDATSRIRRFTEKPRREDATSNLINAGTYILEPEVLDRIPPDTFYMFEHGVFPGLLLADRPMFGFATNAYWIDIGAPEKYLQAHRDILNGRLADAVVPHVDGVPTPAALAAAVWTGDDVVIAPTAELIGPLLIGDGCRIGAGARLTGPVTLGAGCIIGDHAVVEDAMLWEHVRVGPSTVVQTAILARDTAIAGNVQITGGAVVADGCRLAADNRLQHGIRLGPGLDLPERAITF